MAPQGALRKNKKLHHYVPRFYLRAWAERETLFCLQDGLIQPRNVKNVCAENYFYRLQQLSAEDVDSIRRVLIDHSIPALKPYLEWLVRAFTAPYKAKQKLSRSGATPEINEAVDRAITEFNEDMHTKIEDDFRPYLEMMISGSLEFLKDPKKAAKFYGGLVTQYARTNHIKNTRFVMEPEQFKFYLRIVNLIAHIVATNVAVNLYADRDRHTIVLLDNSTDVPFITADQPVINTAASPKQTAPPERFELYYPLSPTKAMLLLDSANAATPNVSKEFVEACNLRMAAHSYRQVLSTSARDLESVKKFLPAYMSCFPNPTEG